MKMKKKAKFSNVHSLEDIRDLKLRLNKKIRVTEKSISDKTDIIGYLFNIKEIKGGLNDENGDKQGIAGYLIKLGIKYVMELLQKKSTSKSVKRFLFYSALAGVSAFAVYKFMEKRKNKT